MSHTQLRCPLDLSRSAAQSWSYSKIQGDMHQINMLYGDGILLAPFTPGCLGSNMYTLESLPLKGLTMTCTLTYNIVHHHLGHPSKDVICHAHKHMWNFPDVEIPNTDSICPGCAMGKLPNRSFPPSEHHATHAFELVLWMTTHQWHGLHLCALKMLHWLQPTTF